MPGIISGRVPGALTQLLRDPPLDNISLEAEILWAAFTCAAYAERLSKFRSMAAEFEKALLKSDFEESARLLNDINSQCGISLWSIENTFALIQLGKGLEQQKAFSRSINAVRGRFDIVAFLSYYLSQRNEESTTPPRFVERLENNLNFWEGQQPLKSYMRFRLTGEIRDYDSDAPAILSHEAVSSIIDYYDTLVRMAEEALARDNSSAQRFTPALKILIEHIEDHRVRKLLFLGTGDATQLAAIPSRMLEIEDALIGGNRSDALWCAQERLAESPEDVSNWLTLILADSDRGLRNRKYGESLAADLVGTLRSIMVRNQDAGDSILRLRKHVLNLRLSSFSSAATAVLESETGSVVTSDRALALRAFVDSPFLEIAPLTGLPNVRAYKEVLCERYANSPALTIQFLRDGDDPSVNSSLGPDSETLAEAQMAGAFCRHEYERSLSGAHKLLQSKDRRISRMAARFLSHCLLEMGNLAELVDFISREGVQDPGVITMLPLGECIRRLTKKERRALAGQIGVPITFDFYTRFVSDDRQNLLAYSYEDFLNAHSLDRPSQVSSISSAIDNNLLIYYLRYICVPENMQSSIAFNGTRQLEDERIAVCQLLETLDPANVPVYDGEVRDTIRHQTIVSGVRQAEQSKIYVDVPAAYRWANRNLKENFDRYMALLRAGLVEPVISGESIVELIESKVTPSQLLVVPQDEPFAILLDIFRVLLEEVTTSPEFGLDCYLSMRIRHGTLSGQLRSALVEQHVITQRQSDTDVYEPNDYWLDALDASDTTIRALDHRLTQFSRDCDKFIERFAKGLVQVRSAERPDGLFDFQDRLGTWALGLQILSVGIERDTTFDGFLDAFFEYFWQIVDLQLQNIRKYISMTLKADWNSLFTDFEADLLALGPNRQITDLNSAVKIAQTNSQRSLDAIIQWFKLAEPAIESKFTLEQLVDIGLAMVRKLHPDFVPEVTKHIADTPPLLGIMTYFVDMFFIVFDNIQQHSGLTAPSVSITAELRDRCYIRIVNEVSPECDAVESALKVAAIKQAIQGDNFRTAVTSEGGTGFIKLRKILGNQRAECPLDFGFTEDSEFFVEFQFYYIRGGPQLTF